MAKEVQPHGTEAGYRRHQRAKEPACGPCREAWSARRVRQQVNAEQRKREEAPVVVEPAVRVSELDETRENLRLVVQAMDSAPASAVAALSRRREELFDRLRKLEELEARESVTASPADVRASFEALMRSTGIDL